MVVVCDAEDRENEGGHMVQGHVDGTGRVEAVSPALSAGGFLAVALRTGRATSTASGSP
jgi:riboflavin synthase alpha subunit